MFRNRKYFIFTGYWFLLFYILAALIWWFLSLNQLNHQITELKKLQPGTNVSKVTSLEKRKRAQYTGEGAIFFLVIIVGAFFVYRSVKKQLTQVSQQQHFMMAVTHELKTPIAVTKINLETLLKRKLDESKQHRLMQNTLQEANRLDALCNNMLLSSQIEAGSYSISQDEINLSDITEHCYTEYETRFPQYHFKKEISENIFLTADPLLLQMAVNNLFDNAVKYSPRHSMITATLNRKEMKAILQVIDEGKGIEETEKQKVFHKFYRIGNAATKSAKGTGLGLYLARKIILAHKGQIAVTNNKPNGCIFTITLNTVKEG